MTNNVLFIIFGVWKKKTKTEIQNLRTQLNLLKKCIGKIEFDIEHLKKEPYDYGEASENLLVDIKNDIKDTKIKLNKFKEN